MPRRACLSIGVSSVRTPEDGAIRFATLDGAIVAARTIGNWAHATGFGDGNVEIVTDGVEDGEVTAARVQAAVDRLFAGGTDPVDHLLLSYCGHGVTSAEVNSTFWLFSDALSAEYRVNVDRFVVELLRFGVSRVTMISDACREGPKWLDLLRYDAVRGIKGRGTPVDNPLLDRMAACQDGAQAFMVRKSASALPGKCIFSGVVADILCKREASAIADGLITTTTLGATARSRTTARAKDYKLALFPQCYVDPLPATLLAAGQEVPADFQLQDWPVVAAGQAMGEGVDDAVAAVLPSPDEVLERARTDTEFRTAVLGEDFGKAALDLDVSKNLSGLHGVSAGALFDLVALHRMSAGAMGAVRGALDKQIENSVRQVEIEAADGARAQVAAQFVARKEDYEHLSAPPSSLVSVGVEVRRIWGDAGTHAERVRTWTGDVEPAPVWQLRPQRNTPIFVETADGMFVPVTPYRMLFTVLLPDPRGGCVQAFGSSYGRNRLDEGLQAIADLASGELTPGKVDAMTANLRLGKHADPVRGVISAYLYRAVADLDSIRRMAFYYHWHDQAVPFDIALLGDMPVEVKNGRLMLHVPAVARRLGDHGALPDYVTCATNAVTARVGGRVPWLAIGWDYVTDPIEEAKLLVEGLQPFASTVARSGFTNLTPEAGQALVDRFGLQLLDVDLG